MKLTPKEEALIRETSIQILTILRQRLPNPRLAAEVLLWCYATLAVVESPRSVDETIEATSTALRALIEIVRGESRN